MCRPACAVRVSYVAPVKVAFTERAKEIMGGLQRSQKFLDVAKVDVCGKMKSLEVCAGRQIDLGALVFSLVLCAVCCYFAGWLICRGPIVAVCSEFL